MDNNIIVFPAFALFFDKSNRRLRNFQAGLMARNRIDLL